jgi:hypothetical protein
MQRLIHFKCAYDPAWDYEKKAQEIFGANKCLVQLEKLGSNAHVHFQGYTTMSERMVKDRLTEFSEDHYIKIAARSGLRLRKIHWISL